MEQSPQQIDSTALSRAGHIFRVSFTEPPFQNDPRREFFFHSLAAIYDIFTPEQVGCKVSHLWNLRVANGEPYVGRKCRIIREPIWRKQQKRP
jgi:hypothetical protein